MSPKINDDGMLSMNLGKVKAGAFGITTFAKQLTQKITETYLDEVKDNNWADDISASLIENKPFNPVFEAYDRHVRLTGIEISKGQAVLRLTPQVDL
jgi:hypothetical protein